MVLQSLNTSLVNFQLLYIMKIWVVFYKEKFAFMELKYHEANFVVYQKASVLQGVLWTARRSGSLLKEINPEYSLEGLMLKLKLQYFGHLMRRANSLEKTLMLGRLRAGGKGDDRAWGGWMASPTQWMWVWANSRRWWRTGKPGVLQSMGSQRLTEGLKNNCQEASESLLRLRKHFWMGNSKGRFHLTATERIEKSRQETHSCHFWMEKSWKTARSI